MKRFARRSVIGAATVLACGLGIGTTATAQQQQQAPAQSAAAAGAVSERNIQPAFTLPYKEYKISFPTMGVIKDVKVKEGDVVKKGDVLMKQEDSEDRAELRILELDVNDFPINAAQAKLKAAEVDYKAKTNLNKASGGYSELEVERALAERDVAKAQLDQAKQELEQKKAKRDKQSTHVENMTLKAGVNGVVQDLINDVGSNVDPTRPVMTLVDNETLLVEVQVPAIASLQLKNGDKLRVSYDRKNWREAAVAFMSPQADAQSGMRKIRLEMPNPQGEPSGLQAFVELPDKLLATAAAK
jgi:multidrug efflux system membrane fusion protein